MRNGPAPIRGRGCASRRRIARASAKSSLPRSVTPSASAGIAKRTLALLRASAADATLRCMTCRVTITAGHEVNLAGPGRWTVPKKELVSVLQVLLQGRLLHVAESLPLADVLAKELQSFKVKVTAA